MRRANDILAVCILVLTAVLLAALGLKAYRTHMESEELERQEEEQAMAEVYARNVEAHNRVQEMQAEIQEMTQDHEKLEAFITQLQNESALREEEIARAERAAIEEGMGLRGEWDESEGDYFFGDDVPEDDSMSGSENVSGNEADGVSDNRSVSGNDSVPEEESVSGNKSVSGNASVSGNGSVSGNRSVSGNAGISGGRWTVSGNSSFGITLEERRAVRKSLEETLMANRKDQKRISDRETDFTGKKIACLGDSITAAANLESEEDYQQYSYPSRLKELLGAEEVYNLGIGGSSIGRYWADAFVERYDDIPEDVDIIIVMGGTNDGFCLSENELGNLDERKPRTFCGDLDELFKGLKEDYPDADIFFATPLPNILQDYLMRERSYLLPQRRIVNVMLKLAQEYDIPVIDMYNSNILDSHDVDIVEKYVPDGVHGNPEGYQILAEHFAAELVRYYEDGSWESVSGNSLSGNSLSGNSLSEESLSGNTVSEDSSSDRDKSKEERKDNTLSGNSAR